MEIYIELYNIPPHTAHMSNILPEIGFLSKYILTLNQ